MASHTGHRQTHRAVTWTQQRQWLHPNPLCGWAAWRWEYIYTHTHICAVWIPQAAGLRLWTSLMPSSQPPHCVTLRDPLSSWLPGDVTSSPAYPTWSSLVLTHSLTLPHTLHFLHQGHRSPPTHGLTPAAALTLPCTPVHTQNREPSPRKDLERSLIRRQDRLPWSGTGHGQPNKLTSQLYTRPGLFIPLSHYFPTLVPPQLT